MKAFVEIHCPSFLHQVVTESHCKAHKPMGALDPEWPEFCIVLPPSHDLGFISSYLFLFI